MAMTLSAAACKAKLDALTALLDVGGAGQAVVHDAAHTVLVTFPLNAVAAFGAGTSANPSVATAAAIANAVATGGAGATADHVHVQNNAGTDVWTGPVPADFPCDGTITTGQTCSLGSWTVSQA